VTDGLPYRVVTRTGNEQFRHQWVEYWVTRLRSDTNPARVLDVGAGASPYRGACEAAGWKYRSHDFGGYAPDGHQPGLQDPTWPYARHDYVCDILAIPPEASAELILCTEVLEHVPDPVATFRMLAELTEPGGHIIATVPTVSLMHQAPYWFSAGLSPFWFLHWSAAMNIRVVELTIQGDYIDFMTQEVQRLLTTRPKVPGLAKVGGLVTSRLRRRLTRSVLTSAGIGTLFVGHKPPAGVDTL